MSDIRATFGLTTEPCTREIPLDRPLNLPPYEAALDGLIGTIQRRQSAALIAPAGTGKTQLLRALVERLPEARNRCHYAKVTDLSKRDMCKEISYAVGCKAAGSYNWLVRNLQEYFTAQFDVDGVRPVVILDEAHDMRPDVLGILRVLTNFEMDSRLVVSFVLSGQPPLSSMLGKPSLEAVARRIAYYARLRTLSRAETARYVEHRCVVAGATDAPFSPAALEAVHEISTGNMRAIDRLVSTSMRLAAADDDDLVDTPHVVDARRTLWP